MLSVTENMAVNIEGMKISSKKPGVKYHKNCPISP